ncbi:hypothetical protein STA1M1_36090 [Sinisalibacter aestuarii]|uniref:Uncharacterized protein n=1 Tax=Sinisalibacter aestuarii TaxID=2949426 RepID=A0ABQ5LZ92_9RHOB|nr:hypothetical protein STA1M1_36090 [Sinisalibacter aestuarii]
MPQLPEGGQGWRRLVIAAFVPKEVLDWGSGCPGCRDVRVWHALSPHLCLLGHPFD